LDLPNIDDIDVKFDTLGAEPNINIDDLFKFDPED